MGEQHELEGSAAWRERLEQEVEASRLGIIPDEVLDRLRPGANPKRVTVWPRTHHSQCDCWDATRKYGKTIGVVERYAYTGWRTRHTSNYYAWYAQDMDPLMMLALEGKR